jgi:hypothetical protein
MRSYCIHDGQTELGMVEHEGQEFSALGATIVGDDVTGYTRCDGGRITLTTWCGTTTIARRCEVVQRFWSGNLALLFRLPKRRYLVGYALGEHGMLFRGEVVHTTDEAEARRMAIWISERFAELDADDEIASDEE